MNLHDKIMNIPCIFQELMSDREKIAHKIGHRDARHAAAEMANEADEIISELLGALEIAASIIGHPEDTMSIYLNEVIAKAKGLDK